MSEGCWCRCRICNRNSFLFNVHAYTYILKGKHLSQISSAPILWPVQPFEAVCPVVSFSLSTKSLSICILWNEHWTEWFSLPPWRFYICQPSSIQPAFSFLIYSHFTQRYRLQEVKFSHACLSLHDSTGLFIATREAYNSPTFIPLYSLVAVDLSISQFTNPRTATQPETTATKILHFRPFLIIYVVTSNKSIAISLHFPPFHASYLLSVRQTKKVSPQCPTLLCCYYSGRPVQIIHFILLAMQKRYTASLTTG